MQLACREYFYKPGKVLTKILAGQTPLQRKLPSVSSVAVLKADTVGCCTWEL